MGQAVTGAPLVWAQFTGGRYPVTAGGERLVGKHRVVSARVFTGYLPEWSDTEEPAVTAPGDSLINHLAGTRPAFL